MNKCQQLFEAFIQYKIQKLMMEQEENQSISEQIQQNKEEQRNKITLQILGEEPFIVQPEEEEANFISCRIGTIKENSLKSQKLICLQLRNNLISEIQGLDNLPNLRQLQLYDNRIIEIKNLDNFPALEILDLSYNNIKVIQNLRNLPKLKKLFLLSNKIKKIQHLDFPELEMLELGSNKISKIEKLENLPNLRSLYLGKNKIQKIQNLGHFKFLEQIALGPNRLTKIQNLQELQGSLKELYLQQNAIQKIQNVNCLHKLQILDVSYNKITKIQNIDQLVNLDALYLTTNLIQNYEDLQVLKANQKLTTVSIFGNDIYKCPGYRMKLVQLLPLIDDIDGTPMKTTYKIVFDSDKKQIKE